MKERRDCAARRLIAAGTTLMVVTVAALPSFAARSELRFAVAAPELSIAADGEGRAVFLAEDMQRLSGAGEPDLPWQVVTVLLPPDVRAETVTARIEGLVTESVAGDWDVAPVGPEATRSGGREVVVWPAGKVIVDGKDTGIYGKAEIWPKEDIRLVQTGQLRKWRLAQVALPLVKYDPAGRALRKIVAGQAVLSFERAGLAGRIASSKALAEFSDRIGEDAVARLAVNYADQNEEYEAAVGGAKAAPMFNGAVTPRFVIITTSAIQTASTKLANFVMYKQSQGFNVSVITESDFGGGTGDTAAENIRNWLKNHYVSDNIEYVLLIGNAHPTTGPVPMKMLYPRGPTGTDVSAPSDIYYADLTGNWNLDSDAYYGEYSGDWGAGGIDRFWEVIVGRIPYCGTVADLDYILQKIMDYEGQPAGSVAWRRSALLPMKDPDEWTAAYRLGEAVKTDTLAPAGWSYHRIWDDATPAPETTPCTRPDVTNVWKTGSFGLVLWWTHGSATSATDVMDTTYAAQLNDTYPSVTFQCSCHNASPETTNNLCYTLLKKGAVCTVGDTRVSWYEQGESLFTNSTTGPGMSYAYTSRIVNDNATTARALYDLTMAMSPTSAQKWMNFVVFNVYGDPATYVLPRCGRRYVNAAAPAGGDGTSWATAYNDLQKAFDDHAMEIWAAAGTYKPDRGTGSRAAAFRLTEKTAVYGGFAGGETDVNQRNPVANVTVLSGDLAGNDTPGFGNIADNSYHVLVGRGCNNSSILDGLTIKGAYANGTSNDIGSGGGIYNYPGSSPVIRNCVFKANRVKFYGGAIYNALPGASPTVSDCTFDGNYAESNHGGAVACMNSSAAKFANCLFTGNSGNYGGAVECNSDSARFVNCTFLANSSRNNRGGAVHGYSSTAAFINCRFLANTANTSGGAVHLERGTATLVNCLFSGNRANQPGGALAFTDSSSPAVVNCTVVGNVSTSTYNPGGGLYTYSSSPSLTNCIFWGNTDKDGITETAQIYQYLGTVTINYSCVAHWSGSMGGTGNTGADPQMPDPDGPDNTVGTIDDDPRLLASSPCMDSGNNGVVPADALDLDGDGDVTEPIPFDLNGGARFTDMPVADSGSGAPPIVDRGVVEGGLQAFLLSPLSLDVPEGGSASLSVRLALDPGGTVEATVARVSGDAGITVQSGASLTFNSSDYATLKTVTLAAAEDADNLNGTAIIAVTASGMPTAQLVAAEIDDEPVAAVLYVDADAPGLNNGADWAGAYTSLQQAMSLAASEPTVVEIRVAEGVYRPADPSGDRESSFRLRTGLTVKGGYAGYGAANPNAREVDEFETILSGDLNDNDGPSFANNTENSFHVVSADGTDSTALLDGFTVTAGNAEGGNPTGGGMRIQNASPTVVNCTFLANSAVDGAGLHAADGDSPVVRSCRFLGNSASSNGGGLRLSLLNDNPVLVNCLFSGNSAGDGAGVHIDSVDAVVVNCTFVANSAGSSGGGLYSNSLAEVTSCVFWGNSANESNDEYAQLNGGLINYSCVHGWTGDMEGVGNHGNDPVFADPNGLDGVFGTPDDDLHLQPGSPCIDAGDSDAVPSGVTTDLEGSARMVDDPDVVDTGNGMPPIVDMGAYERNLGGPRADLDGDGDVDVDDLTIFEQCASGPGIPYPSGEICPRVDFDTDDDVDQTDFSVMQRCYSGEGGVALADCAD